MQVPPIEAASKVIEAFGYFPDFHDAEIIKLEINRNRTPEESYSTVSLTFTLHGWEMTSEITASGHFQLRKHHLITFRFDHIDEVKIQNFNHQNVISELSICKIEPVIDHALIQVDFGSCFGIEGGFRAVSGSVIDLVQCDEDAQPINS